MNARRWAPICLSLTVLSADGADYPSRPIRAVIPFAPGGGTDIVARAVGTRLEPRLHQSIVIDNRAGAGGLIGTDIAAKATPDGYTLLMATAANAANASLVKKMPHDFAKDFEPISLVVMSPYLLVVNSKVKARSIPDLIALAKHDKGALNYASSGTGSSAHLSGILLNQMAGTEMVHVPFRGAGPALTEVVAGRVEVLVSSIPAAMPFIKSGSLRPLAVTSAHRSRGLPAVPTVSEAGLSGYAMSGWYGLLTPAGSPAAVIGKLSAEVREVLRDAALQDQLGKMGLEPVGSTPGEFRKFIAEELGKYERLVKAAGLWKKS